MVMAIITGMVNTGMVTATVKVTAMATDIMAPIKSLINPLGI